MSARGLLLGLVLGDAIDVAGCIPPPGATPLRNSVAAQLACVTIEGLVRAAVRQRERGICHPPSVVWHALVRWAYGHGIDAPGALANWQRADGGWPDGWLAQVPLLKERRGNAPATVAALRVGRPGDRSAPTTESGGSHALVRALPVAALGLEVGRAHELAADIAVQTHGSPAGFVTAAETVVLASQCVDGQDVRHQLAAGIDLIGRLDPYTHHADVFSGAVEDGRAGQPDAVRLRTFWASDRGATATVSGALYTAAAHPTREQVRQALAFAAGARGVATVTGALLGATHGVAALPLDLLSRCDLGWVADTLARDLLRELGEGDEDDVTYVVEAAGSTASEQRRYPGW